MQLLPRPAMRRAAEEYLMRDQLTDTAVMESLRRANQGDNGTCVYAAIFSGLIVASASQDQRARERAQDSLDRIARVLTELDHRGDRHAPAALHGAVEFFHNRARGPVQITSASQFRMIVDAIYYWDHRRAHGARTHGATQGERAAFLTAVGIDTFPRASSYSGEPTAQAILSDDNPNVQPGESVILGGGVFSASANDTVATMGSGHAVVVGRLPQSGRWFYLDTAGASGSSDTSFLTAGDSPQDILEQLRANHVLEQYSSPFSGGSADPSVRLIFR